MYKDEVGGYLLDPGQPTSGYTTAETTLSP